MAKKDKGFTKQLRKTERALALLDEVAGEMELHDNEKAEDFSFDVLEAALTLVLLVVEKLDRLEEV